MDHCLSFCTIIHLAIVLSDLQCVASDYPFRILKLFVEILDKENIKIFVMTRKVISRYGYFVHS